MNSILYSMDIMKRFGDFVKNIISNLLFQKLDTNIFGIQELVVVHRILDAKAV
jgi:hypothetical protein